MGYQVRSLRYYFIQLINVELFELSFTAINECIFLILQMGKLLQGHQVPSSTVLIKPTSWGCLNSLVIKKTKIALDIGIVHFSNFS